MYTETSPSRSIGRRLLGSGLVDILTGPHGVDRYVEIVRPAATLRDLRAEVVRVRRMTSDSVTLTLAPNDLWRGFEPGQFVRVTVEVDGVRRSRCYSPASSAHDDGAFELTVKTHHAGEVSRYLRDRAETGLALGLDHAAGDFRLPADRPANLLLISGGSGITPVMSMLRTLCAEGHTDPITFLHYAPTRRDALYTSELDDLAARHRNVRMLRAYTRAPGGSLRGHFGREHLELAVPRHAECETFVCGPPGLMDAARALWAQDDIEDRLHVESFVAPSLAPAESGAAEGTVSFAASGLSAANDGRTLLDQAEAAGLSPETGCRMGICHSCTCRKTAGSVRNLLTGEVSSGEEADIQICVSAAVGDVALDL
jgi:ferredoxin-NADP reductase